MYNNGSRPREWSTIDEWWAPRDANDRYPREVDEPWGPSVPAWTYPAEQDEDFFGRFISGVQRLPNGNTLICSGDQPWILEISPDKQVVWETQHRYGGGEDEAPKFENGAMFRAPGYAPDYLDPTIREQLR